MFEIIENLLLAQNIFSFLSAVTTQIDVGKEVSVYYIPFLFVCSLSPSQHFFSHVGIGLSGLNQYTKRGLMYHAQGHNAVPSVRLEPVTFLSSVKHSTTELYLLHTLLTILLISALHFLCSLFFVNNVGEDQLASYRRSAGFIRSQLIWIHTVCHQYVESFLIWIKLEIRY